MAEKLVSDLKETLTPKMDAAPPGVPSAFPFKVLSLREPLLHRIVDLVEASIYLCKNDKGMGAAILARAVLEATALLFALLEMVEGINDENFGDFERRLNAMLLGSKNKTTPLVAVNIWKQIQKMDKSFEGIEEHYGLLSELAHPNFAGVLNSYGRLGSVDFELILGPRDKLESIVGQVVIPTLCYCLVASGRFSDRISAVLAKFFALHLRAHGQASENGA